jgi:hypothetical protein
MRMNATSKAGGQCVAYPDVCKTPAAPSPLPIPYPNTGDPSGADDAIDVVLIEKKATVVESSKIPSSKGDEAGTLKGVKSSTNRDEVTFKKYSSKVFAKGKKIVFHTATTAHNGSSANMPAGAHIKPSQTKVKVGT